MLTAKQKAFADEYITCNNATQAYKTVYNCENSSYQTIRNNAAVVLNSDAVQDYLKTITEQVQEKVINTVIMDRERKKQIINERIEKCMLSGDDAAIARYIDILNKMDAEYIQKTENVNTNTVLTGLDTDTLKQLIK